MPRLAANLTMMFCEHAFPERFKAAADAGFTAVEFLFPYDYPAEILAERLASAGLKQVLFNVSPGDWAAGDRGLAALPHRQQEFRAAMAQALHYAGVLGTPLIHVMAGIADDSDPAAWACYRDALAFAADQAGEKGIAVTIEPINRRDMPGYLLSDFDRAIDLITGLSRPNLKLQFDIYHRQIIRGDVLRGLEQAMPLIGHVQIAAVPHRHEPGTGELDDIVILRALDALGYQGHVGCEYRPAGDTLAGLSWMDRL